MLCQYKALSGLTSSGYYQPSDAGTRGHSGTRWFVRFVWIYMNCWKLPHLKTPAASWTEYHSSFLHIIICSMSPSLGGVINKAESDSSESECLRHMYYNFWQKSSLLRLIESLKPRVSFDDLRTSPHTCNSSLSMMLSLLSAMDVLFSS